MRTHTGAHGCARAAGVLGDLHRYDPGRDEWGELGRAGLLGEAPTPRQFHRMVAAAGSLYVFGRGEDGGMELSDDMYDCNTIHFDFQFVR